MFQLLSDDLLCRVLCCLLPQERLRLATVSRRFARLLRLSEGEGTPQAHDGTFAFAVLDWSALDVDSAFGGCFVCDAQLARFARCSGARLRVLNTTGMAGAQVTASGIVAALSAAPNLEVLTVFALAPLHAVENASFLPEETQLGGMSARTRFFSASQLRIIAAACPALREASVAVCEDAANGSEALAALAALPRAGVKALLLLLPRAGSAAACAVVDRFADAMTGDDCVHALAFLRTGMHRLAPAPRTRHALYEDDVDMQGDYDTGFYFLGEDDIFVSEDVSGMGPHVARACACILATSATLTALDVSMQGIGDEGIAALAGALAQPGCALRQLFVGQNGITEAGATQLAAALHAGAPIAKLSLYGNLLHTQGLAAVCDAVAEPACAVRVLDVSRVQHPQDCSANIPSAVGGALARNPRLVSVNLSGQDYRDDAAPLIAGLAQNTRLHEFVLHHAELDARADVRGLLLAALRPGSSVRRLTLSASVMGRMMYRGSSAHAAQAFDELTRRRFMASQRKWAAPLHAGCLRQLSISCLLNPGDAAALCECLARTATRLEKLNLSCNNLSSGGGAAQLGSLLSISRTLTHVNVTQNTLNGKDVAAIASGLAANSSLRVLVMSGCSVTRAGAAALARAVATHASLELLDVTNNKVGDKGARAFAAALRTNASLRVLRLFVGGLSNIVLPLEMSRNGIGVEAEAELCEAAARRGVILADRQRR